MLIRYFIYGIFAAATLAAGTSYAQTVEILGITNDGQNGQIKAKLDTGGKVISGVRTYSYNMTDGYTVTNTKYQLFDDENGLYLSAPVAYYPDSDGYTYRIELIFSDNTNYLTPVVNETLTESFMWLGDYQKAPYFEGVSGWDTAHPPTVDKEIDSSLQFTLDGRVYYKGVSNHAPGYLIYKLPDEGFTRFVTRYGVQDTQSYGDVQFIFYTGKDPNTTITDNLKEVENQVMYAKSNPDKPANVVIFAKDLDIDMKDVRVLRIQMNDFDNNNWGDHGNLALARLYMPAVSQDKKKEQNVSFTTEGSDLTGEIQLKATSTSNGKVFYNIISGQDYATLEGDILKPVWGAKGIVVVEATQFGNDRYYPATSYISFNVDTKPRIEFLNLYQPTVEQTDKTAYASLLIDTKGKSLDKLNVEIYDNPKTLKVLSTESILDKFNDPQKAQVIEIPITNYDRQVLGVTYSYAGNDADMILPYWHSEGSYDYISDFPTSSYTVVMGYGSFPGANHPYNKMNGDVMEIGNGTNSIQTYKKGFGIHATGYVNIAAEYLAPYNRIITDIGAQKDSNADRQNQKLTFRLMNGNTLLADTVDVKKPGIQYWDFPINNQQPLRIVGDCGSDNNGNDYVCIGAPRLYYSRGEKTPQTLSWITDSFVINNHTSTVNLDAVSENGFPVFYHLVQGAEYAHIENNTLIISQFPLGGEEIVVDAYQPGNDVWAPSQVATCRFRIVRGREVQIGEYADLKGPDTYDELIIHADKSASGQVAVTEGIVDVKKLILKYNFVPGEWVHIAFPADLDIDKISNLKSLGYTFNAFGSPAYYIKEYNTDGPSFEAGEKAWKMLDAPLVKANRGYIMSLGGSAGDPPAEVTFTIDNTKADLVNLMKALSLTIDFTGMEPGKKQTITVASANPEIKSNNLTVEVEFKPADTAKLPINHEKALENMRYVFVGDHKAIRLTLPDQSPAKVVFFDKNGKNVVKAVRYIAPNVIDLSELKSGNYNMVVSYGNAVKTWQIEL